MSKASFQKLLFIVFVAAYFMAGLNHFLQPDFYKPMFPEYMKAFASELNMLAGVAEIGLALGICIPTFRKYAALGIVAMLIAFIPVHVYMIEVAPFTLGGIQMESWMAWVRLLVLHPFLIFWAYSLRNYKWS
jgi:uncharacterized membrane protein